MRGDVQAAGLEIKADLLRHEAHELVLLIDGQFQFVEGVGGFLPARHQIDEQRLQSLAQGREDSLHFACGATGLVVFGERIPRLAALGPAVTLGFAPQHLDGLLQVRLELLEV